MRKITLAALLLFGSTLAAQDVPRYEVDPSWPKPLLEGWITGQLGGVCVDSHDHVVVVNRRNIIEEEAETSMQAPSIIMFDATGNLVASWGDSDNVPQSIHGCTFDTEDNVWVGGNQDAIVQKYSHEGELLMQIGTRGDFDSSTGRRDGEAQNSGRERLFNPAGVAIDPENGDIYVADGYGNRRIAVFDKTGEFLRQWGRQATREETEAGVGGVFSQVVHCVAMSNAGNVYVCDRQSDRIQVFDKTGKFLRSIWIRNGTPTLPDPRGTAWWVAFSRAPEQRYMYVMNGRNETVHVLDHVSGEILSSFGRPGHQSGNFTHGHTIALDSAGNIYVAETNFGRRVHRFKPVQDN